MDDSTAVGLGGCSEWNRTRPAAVGSFVISVQGEPRGMYHYRIFEFSREGMIAATTEVDCADDLAAIQRASALQKRFRMEIWQANRLVASLDVPPEPRER